MFNRIKYTNEKKRVSHLILLVILNIGSVHLLFFKKQGAYTESFDIDPKFTNQSHLIAKFLLKVPVDTAEYRRSTLCLSRR